MGLRFSIDRSAATAADVDAALERLDAAPGLYFGCDAGVPGLHPLQATLLVAPAIAIRIHGDGVVALALDAFGAALLRHPALAAFDHALGRGAGRSALDAARAFLGAFDGAGDALLAGALRFDAHRLPRRSGADDAAELGVLFFADTLLRRDAAGDWQRVVLRFEDAGLAAAQTGGGERPVDDGRGHAASGTATPGRASRALPCGAPGFAQTDRDGIAADDFAPGAYAAVIARAVECLAQRPLVSLTLSQSFRRRVGAVSAAQAFAALRRANPGPATFFLNSGDGELVFGASPDLQLWVHGCEIESFPVCGTVARGHGPVGEAESFRELINADVDAASLAICTDALREDLAPLCVPGSLALRDRRRPLALATVVHAVDRLGGRLRAGVDAWDAIAATAAPAMVTGTPRHLALAAIAELEASPRGWYGGLVVQVAADGDALVGTILRAAAIRDGTAEVRTGGDLLADSDPEREELESRVKAVSLWRALGLAVDAGLQASIAGSIGVGRRSYDPLPAAVALCDAGDPFAASMTESLQGLGLLLRPEAPVRVLIGADEAGCLEAAAGPRLVAVGDAAARVLQQTGFAVAAIRPEHGRLMRCRPGAAAPLAGMPPFHALRYATLGVDWAAERRPADAADWSVWATDADDRPVALAHRVRRTVCLLLRPDSLLADPAARDLLRVALAFAADPET